MRTTIYVKKELVIFILLLLLNIFFLWKGMVAYDKAENSIPIERLTAENCKEGSYVVGSIDSYARSKVSDENGTVFTNAPIVRVGGTSDYLLYTIPAGEGQFVRIWIGDRERLEALEGFSNGYGAEIPFEGQLVKMAMDDHYKNWADEVVREDFSTDKVIADYALQEISIADKKKMMDAGFTFLIVTFLQFLSVRGVVVTEQIPPKPDRIPTRLYAVKDMLKAEQKRLQILNYRLENMRKSCICAIVALALSLVCIVVKHYLELFWIDIFVIVFAGREIWQYIFHAGFVEQKGMIKVSVKEPLVEQISECEACIKELQIRIDDAEYI